MAKVHLAAGAVFVQRATVTRNKIIFAKHEPQHRTCKIISVDCSYIQDLQQSILAYTIFNFVPVDAAHSLASPLISTFETGFSCSRSQYYCRSMQKMWRHLHMIITRCRHILYFRGCTKRSSIKTSWEFSFKFSGKFRRLGHQNVKFRRKHLHLAQNRICQNITIIIMEWNRWQHGCESHKCDWSSSPSDTPPLSQSKLIQIDWRTLIFLVIGMNIGRHPFMDKTRISVYLRWFLGT